MKGRIACWMVDMLRLGFSLLALLVLLPGPVSAEGDARRIVAVGGAVTEILYALGEEGRIVGVDTTSTFPERALREKPNVGYLRQLSAEGVLALSPDLVILEAGAGPREAVASIAAAGLRVERVPTGHSVAELDEKVRRVAAAVGKAREGEAMAEGLMSAFDRLASDLRDVGPRRRVLFVLSLVDGRPNGAGRDTGADAVIRLAGGENVLADVEGYKALSLEAAVALAPDVILVVSRAGDDALADPLSVPALAATPAGRAGAVIRMDAGYLLGFGPRTPAAVRDLAARLYPDRGLEAAHGR